MTTLKNASYMVTPGHQLRIPLRDLFTASAPPLSVTYDDTSITIITNSTGGTTAFFYDDSTSGTVLITYDSYDGFTGLDHVTFNFRYGAAPHIVVSNNATLYFAVIASIPVAADAILNVQKNVVKIVNTVPLLSNVPPNLVFVPQVVTRPGHGSATISGSNIRYQPQANYLGQDSIVYNVIIHAPAEPGILPANLASVTSNSATLSLNVVIPPVLPAVLNSTIVFNTETEINISSHVTNATDFTMTVLTKPKHGNMSILQTLEDGTSLGVLFTPTPGYIGTDSVVFNVTASNGFSNNCALVLHIGLPVVTGGSISLPGAVDTTIDLTANITNWTPTSVVHISTAPRHGTTKIVGKTIIFTPTIGYTGADSFNFTVTNAAGVSDPATATITITPAYARAFSMSTPKNTPKTIPMSSLTSVADGAVILIGTAKGGTVAVTSDGLVYTPAKDAVGTDTFTYQITDGTLVSKPATITFTITKN